MEQMASLHRDQIHRLQMMDLLLLIDPSSQFPKMRAASVTEKERIGDGGLKAQTPSHALSDPYPRDHLICSVPPSSSTFTGPRFSREKVVSVNVS